MSLQNIRQLICKEGVQDHKQIPTWMKRRRPASVHILADNHLGERPIGDQQCKLTYFQHLPLAQWIDKIRKKLIPLNSNITVLYLQKLRNLQLETLLKNRLAQICRIIRMVAPETRVFICDSLPPRSNSLLEHDVIRRYNMQLFKATQHVNREFGMHIFLQVFMLTSQIWMETQCSRRKSISWKPKG